jgi:hypothetical protein
VWPKAIGIPAIIFGGLGVLSLGMQSLMWIGAAMDPDNPLGEMFGSVADRLVLMALAGALLSVLLLIGGIGLVSRRRWSVGVFRVWAVLGMLLVAGWWMALGPLVSQFFGGMAEAPPDADAVGSFFMVMMMCGSVLFGILPSLFVLIWFGRRRIKEEVSGWA